MLSEEESSQIKKQIIQQIDSAFPENKKESAKQQVLSMNESQLEEFLNRNNLVKDLSGQADSGGQESIFRAIINEKIPSHKIDENKDAIAVLEINPVSKGHTILIPKKPVSSSEEISGLTFSLAKEIAKKLKAKLKAKDVHISSSNLFGESIVNVLPIYKDESISSKRYKAEDKELEELQEKLEKKVSKVEKIVKKPIVKISEKIRLPKRIP